MTKKQFIATTLIILMIGLVFGTFLVIAGKIDEIGEIIAFIIFIPIWFLGIYFCGFPWKKLLPGFLFFESFRFYRRTVKQDKYDIVANLIGGLSFAFLCTLGWIIGLVRFFIYLIKCIKGEL